MKLKIIRKNISHFNTDEKVAIDKFNEEYNGLIFHETGFNEIVSECFNTNLSYALSYQKDKLIGICPMHSIKRGILKSSYSNPSQYEVPYGGWVLKKELTSYSELTNKLEINFNEMLTCWTSLLAEPASKFIEDNSKTFFTVLIDLSKAQQDIWEQDINSKRRNMIRKAEKSAITIRQFGTDGLDIFYTLLLEMNKKTGMHSKIKEYYEKILKKYYPAKAVILLASLNGEIIAGNMLIGNTNAFHYWQGASKLGIENLGQGELLQWESIKWAKSGGSKSYDLCVVEQERLPNIAQFKMGFSKELVPFYCITKKTFTFRVINKIQNVFIN